MNAQQQQLLTSVQSAIYALYHPNHEQPTQHAQADAFLRDFTLTAEAWEIAGILILHSKVLSILYFFLYFFFKFSTKNTKNFSHPDMNEIEIFF